VSPKARDEVQTAMEANIVDALKLNNYVLINYRHPEVQSPINFYMAYCDTRSKGASVHSPRSCLPGNGWLVQTTDRISISYDHDGKEVMFHVNRAVIQKEDKRNLVYYWFQQRGRMLANEYLVKWYLFWDSRSLNRTDDALVRLAVALPGDADTAQYDAYLVEFVKNFYPLLEGYIPS
jgi:EpsI family protein